jgi:hypothetical protein
VPFAMSPMGLDPPELEEKRLQLGHEVTEEKAVIGQNIFMPHVDQGKGPSGPFAGGSNQS